MKSTFTVFFAAICLTACSTSISPDKTVDQELLSYVSSIRSVDNHTHANSTAPDDPDSDALPLDAILPIALPEPAGPNNPWLIKAFKSLYGYQLDDLADNHTRELRDVEEKKRKELGDGFPTWVLDQTNTEIMLANRISMGPGLPASRFRWVSYADALIFPLSNQIAARTTKDREKLFALEEKLLHRYLSGLKLEKLPPTLGAYTSQVITPILEAQKRDSCLAVKFEAAYLRSLDFAPADEGKAASVYARYSAGGVPSLEDYKVVQDYLFRYIALECGRLGMAIHIHSFEGAGNFFDVTGADPLLLESVFNDPTLRKTNFVLIHGGGMNYKHARAMAQKPNVYLDFSLISVLYTESMLTEILRDWLSQYPDKILYGSDASPLSPEANWDTTAWIANQTARKALASALTRMVNDGEINKARARELAKMALRSNASKLYQLGLN